MESGLFSLPYQLLVDNVLPRLDLRSLVRLRLVSRELRAVVDDQVLWRRLIADDYHFPVSTATARQTGWQDLYKGLSNPEVYVWGDTRNHRLGSAWQGEDHIRALRQKCNGISFPIKLDVTSPHQFSNGQLLDGAPEGEVGVPVQLHAGGWSFFALTTEGRILAWGSANERDETASDGAYRTFPHPTLLDMGSARAKTLSVGRSSMVAQTRDGDIWQWWDTWDQVHCLTIQSLVVKAGLAGQVSSSTPSSTFKMLQVEAGWDFTVALIRETPRRAGQFDNVVHQQDDPGDDELAGAQTHLVLWDMDWAAAPDDEAANGILDLPVVALPHIPEQIVKVAAGENFIVALSHSGKVYHLYLTSRRDPDQLRNLVVTQSFRLEWKLLPNFCIPKHIRESGAGAVSEVDSGDEDASGSDEEEERDDGFNAIGDGRGQRNIWNMERFKHLVDDKTKITHITAQFRSFAVYAPDSGEQYEGQSSKEGGDRPKGIVLLGSSDATAESRPVVHARLQGQEVIKVTHGDWHTGALTRDGRVLAWGAWSNGALGTWDSIPHHRNAPSLISGQFATPPSPFVGDATAAAAAASSRASAASRGTGIFSRLRQSSGWLVTPPPRSDNEENNDAFSVPAHIPRTRDEAEEEEAHTILENRIRQQQQQRNSETEREEGSREERLRMHDFWRKRLKQRVLPLGPTRQPTPVCFGFRGLEVGSSSPDLGGSGAVDAQRGVETKFVFDLAFAGWHSGALAIDKSLLGAEASLQSAPS